MTKNFKRKFKYPKIQLIEKNNKECCVSKASSEIMLDRICVNNKHEFPFINFLGS